MDLLFYIPKQLGFQLSQPNAKKNTKITVGGTGIILKINK
jgi:hypothetical protein